MMLVGTWYSGTRLAVSMTGGRMTSVTAASDKQAVLNPILLESLAAFMVGINYVDSYDL